MEEKNIVEPIVIDLSERNDDKIELQLDDNHEFFIELNGKKVFIKKKNPTFPNTYEGCCKSLCEASYLSYNGGFEEKLRTFQKLLICRQAYWDILEWRPDYRRNCDSNSIKYTIEIMNGEIAKSMVQNTNRVLSFPTEQSRDEFLKNFEHEIKLCAEFI